MEHVVKANLERLTLINEQDASEVARCADELSDIFGVIHGHLGPAISRETRRAILLQVATTEARLGPNERFLLSRIERISDMIAALAAADSHVTPTGPIVQEPRVAGEERDRDAA